MNSARSEKDQIATVEKESGQYETENLNTNGNQNNIIVISNNKTKSNLIQSTIDKEDNKREIKYNYINIIFICANVGLGFFFFGYNIGVFNSMQEFLSLYLSWGENKTLYISIIASVIAVGGLFGSIGAGTVASKIGRRYSIVIIDLLGIVGNLITIIPNSIAIIFGRFIVGISVGSFSAISPLYIKEYVPVEISGWCAMIFNLLFCISVLVSFFIGNGLPIDPQKDLDNKWWQFMFAFPSILLTLNLITILFIYRLDTPKYLFLQKNDPELAKQALSYIYQDESDIINHLKTYDSLKISENNKQQVTFADLFRTKYLKRTLTAIIVCLSRQCSMIISFTAYSNLIFSRFEDVETGKLFTILFQSLECVGSLLSFYLIQKFGRKPLMVAGYGFGAILVLTMGILYAYSINTVQKYIILAFFLIAGFSIDPITWIYNADVLPDKGCGLVACVSWISGLVVAFCFPYMIESNLGFPGSFIFFSGVSVVLVTLIFFFVKETKNKTENEIELIYSSWCYFEH